MILSPAKNKDKSKHSAIKTRAGLARKISDQTAYIANNETVTDAMIFTNCSSIDHKLVAKEMAAWADLNTRITDPTRHVIFSPEPGDRTLTSADWQRMIDIYKEERGLGDALYYAVVHSDGHADRHSQHMHLYFIRIKSDGKAVPDKHDIYPHRRSARRIEKELGLKINPKADPDFDPTQKEGLSAKELDYAFTGRSRQTHRDLSAQRRGETDWRVDPEKVQNAINNSISIKQLRHNLKEVGIECRMRQREGGVYAWSLRNEGTKEWTHGSKLVNGNAFGWAKVQDQLDTNKANKPKSDFALNAQRNSKKWSTPRPMPIRAPKSKKKATDQNDIEQQVQDIENQAQKAFSIIVGLLKEFAAGAGSGSVGTGSGEQSSGEMIEKTAEKHLLDVEELEKAQDKAKTPGTKTAQRPRTAPRPAPTSSLRQRPRG